MGDFSRPASTPAPAGDAVAAAPSRTGDRASFEPPAAGLTNQALIGTGWSALSNFARQGISLVCVAILARRLGSAAYGLMGMASLILVFLTNFRDLGTAAAIVQRPVLSKSLVSSLFWLNSLLGAVMLVIGEMLAAPAAGFFHEPMLAGILQVISATFFVTALGAVQNALLARRMAFHRIAMADFASAIALYAVAIPCAFAGMGVWSLVMGSLAGAAVSTTLYWAYSGFHPAFEWDFAGIRSIGSFSLNLTGSGMVSYFSRNADNIVIGRVLGSGVLGYYQMAYSLFLYPLLNVTLVIAQVLRPALSRIQDDNQRFRSAYVRCCMLIGLVTFPLMAGMAVVVDPFIRTLLGNSWAPVIPILRVLAPVGFMQSVQNTTGQILVAKGRTATMFRLNIYTAAVYVAAFVAGVRWGALGVAEAYALVYFTLVLYPSLKVAFRFIDLSVADFARQLFPQIAISLGMAAACLAWLSALRAIGVADPRILLSSTVLIGVAVYLSAMATIRPPVVDHLAEVLETSNAAVAGWLLRVVARPDRRAGGATPAA